MSSLRAARFAWVVSLAALALTACTFPATEVLVELGTDAPAARALTVRVTARRGAAITGPGEAQSFVRGGARGTALFPGSFAITPGAGPRDGAVTLVLEAALEAGAGPGEPAVSFRRIARFSFTPRTPTGVRVFFAMACGNAAAGCTTPGAACTVAQRCEEQGLTCGDRGECVAPDLVPVPLVDAGAQPSTDAGVDAAPDVPAPDLCDGGPCPALPPPRPIAPLSGATVTSQRPRLRWSLPAGADGARVELCRDRACARVEYSLAASGAALALDTVFPPALALARGVWYWRLHVRSGAREFPGSSPVWQFTVGARSAPTDATLAPTADYNGDGFADVAVGAPSSRFDEPGQVHVFPGGAAGPASSRVVSLAGPDGAAGRFGISVANAGDVNGDGYADLLAGAHQAAGGLGRAYLFYGGAAGVRADNVVPLDSPDAINGNFGYSVAGAGDVDGDGYGDVIVGAWGAASSVGRAYVYHGGPTGLATRPTATLAGTADANARFGFSVAGAGDVDGDGYADVIVGAPGTTSMPGGAAFVFRGGAGGVVSSLVVSLADPGGADAAFGHVVAGAGDVDGDGYADVLVGAPRTAALGGAAYVFPGRASGVDATPIVRASGGEPGAQQGAAGAGAGDLNGDGGVDHVLAAPYATGGGNVHVRYGPPTTGLIQQTDAPSGYMGFGLAVAMPGDVDGDGYGDLVVAAQGMGATPGAVFVYRGGAAGVATSPSAPVVGPAGGNGGFGGSVARAPEQRRRARTTPRAGS